MAKRKTKRKTKKQPAKLDKLKMPVLSAAYATRLGAKELSMFPGSEKLFYDKPFIDSMKEGCGLIEVAKPADPGFVGYKVNYTTTPRPTTHTFTQQDVFKALQDFGNNIMDLIDASISNDRQRKAFKKLVNASYEKQMEHTKGLARNALRLFNYDLTAALKNTEDSNASIHTS